MTFQHPLILIRISLFIVCFIGELRYVSISQPTQLRMNGREGEERAKGGFAIVSSCSPFERPHGCPRRPLLRVESGRTPQSPAGKSGKRTRRHTLPTGSRTEAQRNKEYFRGTFVLLTRLIYSYWMKLQVRDIETHNMKDASRLTWKSAKSLERLRNLFNHKNRS